MFTNKISSVVRGLGILAILLAPLQLQAAPAVRPNVLIIVADDLGFTDIGPYGSEISTPSLDRLAAEGVSLSNFHTLPTCAPTRSVLLTGHDNHNAGIGSQLPTDNQRVNPGYEGFLSPGTPTIAEVLSEAGYHTYLSGKWHLGVEEGQRPHDRGFQETFSLLSGAASHYADAFPISPDEPVYYTRNGTLVETLPADFYSSHAYADHLLAWLEQDRGSEQPFFAYLSFTAPHDPLHAPEEYIVKYKGVYDDGYQALLQRRYAAAKEKRVLPDNLALGEWPGYIKPWASLPGGEQTLRRRDMETYAAMIDLMDEQIGRVIQWLEDNSQLDNTLVLFFSDNGANPFPATIYGGHTREYHQQFNNSLENRGLPGSFTEIGAGWAAAASGGFRLFKGFSTEGGIRTPAIIKPLGGGDGAVNHSFVHVSDIMPTILELAGVAYPAEVGTETPDMAGKSRLRLFNGDTTQNHQPEGVGYELHGTRAYFDGPWKILQMPAPLSSGKWELYNLIDDPAERINLAAEQPQVLARMIAEHEAYEKEVGVIYELVGSLLTVARIVILALAGLFVLALPGLVSGLRNKNAALISLAVAQLVGATCIVLGMSTAGLALLAISVAGMLWHSFSNRKWLALAIPVVTALLALGHEFLTSGRAVRMLLG
ncbi:arylsulfatase [Halioglobus maricola]|nr:arylsulfatase [Halioglobus maricola]